MNLNHLHLHVRDLGRSQRFYQTHFGFRRHARHGDIVFLADKKGFSLALALDPRPARLPRWFHFGFRLSSRAAVRKSFSDLKSQGVPVAGFADYGGYVTFRCTDPDGHQIEIYRG
ncbi:MAG: VOC family protein [Acidobacteria bacterium]|nr:VOC family protein [Acidobacteriota bacterium]